VSCRENEAEGVCNRFAAALTSTSDAARGKGTSGASTLCRGLCTLLHWSTLLFDVYTGRPQAQVGWVWRLLLAS